MKQYLGLLIFFFFSSLNGFSQDIEAVHHVEYSQKQNNYTIKTIISGLDNVGLARVVYRVDSAHTYSPSLSSQILSVRKENLVTFYMMEAPVSGELAIEFGLQLSSAEDVDFEVEFQYFSNEERKKIDFPKVTCSAKQEEVQEIVTENLIEEELLSQERNENKQDTLKNTVEKKTTAKEELSVLEEKKTAELSTKTAEQRLVPKKQYAIQLLSLSSFSQDRLDYFCKKHQLEMNKLWIKRSGDWTKIIYGKFETKDAANLVIAELAQKHNLMDAIIIVVM